MKSLNRFLISIIIVLIVLILEKSDIKVINVKKNMNILKTSSVFSNIFNQNNDIKVDKQYIKCKKIKTNKNYSEIYLEDPYVISISSGIIIYIGYNKETLTTIILQDQAGNTYLYGNLNSVTIKLYNYVDFYQLLALANDNILYFVAKDKFDNIISNSNYYYEN